jgi:hypothetical protein
MRATALQLAGKSSRPNSSREPRLGAVPASRRSRVSGRPPVQQAKIAAIQEAR